jgi:ankyrin repeat protein
LTALFLTDPHDDRDRLIQVKGPRVEGTCEWIKTNELYNSWLHSQSQLLWLSGGPGKGKTMLSIYLAEELEQRAKDLQDAFLMQFFCDNKDEKRNTAIAIVRGLIWQLLRLRPRLFTHILPSFQDRKETNLMVSFEALWRIFESMVRDPVLGTAYCIIDGLDECDEASLEVLLKKFRTLFSTKSNESLACRLNLIAVSRDLPDFIPEVLSGFPRLRLDPDADDEVYSDIRLFINDKVDKLSLSKHYPEPLRVHVRKVFLERAKGTFLWVGIVASELRKYTSSEVGNVLELFPSGLEGLYARMLLQISEHRRETAAKILRWVVMAVRPLSLLELSAAVGTTAKSSISLSCEEVMREQATFCGYFLTVKEDEVTLIHQSAKDYLLRKTPDSNPELEFFRIRENKANLEIAQRCLAYLQNGALTGGKLHLRDRGYQFKDTSRLKAFPLLSYAALHWPEHARSLASSEDIFDLSSPFYKKNSSVRETWLQTYWASRELGDPPGSFSLLHLASYLGIVPLAEKLVYKKGWMNRLKSHVNVSKGDGSGNTALHWAARSGHEAVVQLLLQASAVVNAKAEYGWTALHEAAQSGHEAVVQLLHQAGATVNAKAADGGTALHWAARSGNESMVQLLLQAGATVDAKDLDRETALHEAARSGNEAVVQLLLQAGATVNAKSERGWTALHWAAQNEHEAVVQLLLKAGATVNAKAKNGWTALHWAAWSGHEAVVQLLLQAGATVNAKAADGGTALHWAARSGNESMVQLLLQAGAK